MSQNKHQIFFDKVDYIKILNDYQEFQISSHSEEQMILIAKAYFIQELYSQCISILNRINHKNKAKILFQKQTLLFKAAYLLDFTNTGLLIKIIDQFQSSKRFVIDKPFSTYHLNVFKEFRSFVVNDLLKQIQNIQNLNEIQPQIKKQQGQAIRLKQNQFMKSHKFQGFPCFLIDKNWRTKQLNFYNNNKNIHRTKDKNLKLIYIDENAYHPGPITNFSIINHIFQIIPYQTKSHLYLNIILFPGEQYQVVNKNHWNYLHQIYGGIPLKRIYGSNPVTRFSNQVAFNQKMIIRMLINFNNKTQIFQTSSYSIWPYGVLPQLRKKYGNGQLKQQNSSNNFKLVGTGKVYQQQNEQPFKFITFQNKNIHLLTQDDVKFQTKLIQIFDFQQYQIDSSPSRGLVGLTNDKLMCYMNSTLQCLSNTYNLSKYFLSNQHIKFLNFLKGNDIGSRAEITCAFADIIKRIWSLSTKSNRDAQIDPSIFKQVFAKRFQIFMENSQQDAHEFLNFLLNCIHDDLNKNFTTGLNKIMKSVKDSTNFQQVRKTFQQNYETYNSSVITDLFKGYTYSTLQCLTCEAKYYNFDMHLTIPLPIPSTTSSLTVSYLNSWHLQSQSIRYNIFLENLNTVGDLIKAVSQKRNKQNKKTQKLQIKTYFYLLGLNKHNYKVENYYGQQTKITKLINSKGRFYFFLYEVSKNNQNPSLQRKIDIQIDSFQNLEHLQNDQKLTLIEYFYQDQRRGYPKLLYVNLQVSQQKLTEVVSWGINEQALKYSGGVATQDQKRQCIQKVKIQKIKSGRPYNNVLKVRLSKRINLGRQKQGLQQIGYQQRKGQFTLQNCLNIYGQKDKILQQQGWICGKCKKVSDCSKQQRIYSVGSHLIIVLKRFKDEQKVCTRIQYPIQGLDITQFIDNNYRKSHMNQCFVYDLYGVIVHRGSLNRGHYYSYCKNQQTHKWYLFDDQLVRQEDDLNIIVDSNAYILFYIKK